MPQKYKLYINNTPVYICENPMEIVKDTFDSAEFLYIKYNGEKSIEKTIAFAYTDDNKSTIILYDKNVESVFLEVLSHFVCIDAAGGLIKNECGQVLLIYRRGAWDMPKGKVDKGETLEQAAIREVEEETGLQKLVLQSKIYFKDNDNVATYHSYDYKGKRAMKVSHWYMMKTHKQVLTPQTEEDIEQALWVNIDELPNYYEDMYPSIKDVLLNVLA